MQVSGCSLKKKNLFRATHAAHGGAHVRGRFEAVAAGLHHSHSNSGSSSAACTTAHGNVGSITHWVRPGIKPASSWMLVRFISAEPRWELQVVVHWMSGQHIECCWATQEHTTLAHISIDQPASKKKKYAGKFIEINLKQNSHKVTHKLLKFKFFKCVS